MKAFQNLGQFREESQFSTWLIRITVNQSLMKRRKQRAISEVSLDEDFQAGGRRASQGGRRLGSQSRTTVQGV